MPQILDAGDFDQHDLHDMDAVADSRETGGRFPWETIPRCLVVAGVVALVAMMSWRPAMLRYSQLMSMVSPSHGESLAWKADDESPAVHAPRKHTLAPAEWRHPPLPANDWELTRSDDVRIVHQNADSLARRDWERFSFNPWAWRDDAQPVAKRRVAEESSPDPQPLTEFRSEEGDDWSEKPAPVEIPAPIAGAGAVEEPEHREEADADAVRDADEAIQHREPSRDGSELPPLSFDDLSVGVQNPFDAEQSRAPATVPSAEDLVVEEAHLPPDDEPIPGIPETSDSADDFDDFDGFDDSDEAPARRESADIGEGDEDEDEDGGGDSYGDGREPVPADSEDWANTEITAPISGAYLTIYPKLKFIGLCVPGQGYIRKYNQVAAPRDLEEEKQGAHDGRTPYGKYYVAARNRGPVGATLILSWPSPEDAARIGLPADQIESIENAWLAQELPPQNTAAGGGIAITGDREEIEETNGGFALETPHMEEVFTALPDGAWVFIQP